MKRTNIIMQDRIGSGLRRLARELRTHIPWLWSNARHRSSVVAESSGKPGTALIIGASSGIGAAFAHALAAQGYNLILVARRAERLAALAAHLQHQHAISAEIMVADLATPADVVRIEQHIGACRALSMLINNAGFGTLGGFAESDLDEQLAMIHVHIVANVRLTRAALPGMIARGRGDIINVASIGAFLPAPDNVTYNATKAFLTSFSASVDAEVHSAGVRVQALCPGFTRTEFHDRLRIDRAVVPRWAWMSADDVVAASLRALGRGPVVYIPGGRNRILVALFQSPLTAPLLRRFARRIVRRANLSQRSAEPDQSLADSHQ